MVKQFKEIKYILEDKESKEAIIALKYKAIEFKAIITNAVTEIINNEKISSEFISYLNDADASVRVLLEEIDKCDIQL